MFKCILLTSLVLILVVVYAEADSESSRTLVKPWNATFTDLLKRDLLHTYDKFARPTQHTKATVVLIDLVIKHIDLDDEKGVLTVNTWVQLHWDDEKLKWDSKLYGDLKVLHLADHELWEPDIALYNSAGSSIDHYGNTHLIVHSNGQVLWVPPAQFSVFCSLDLSKWPFDKHTCTLILGSWTYDGNQVNLTTSKNKVEVEKNFESNDWEILEVVKERSQKYYSCCEEPYIDVTFNITIKRKSVAYYSVVITPAFALVMLTLGVFWLPPHAAEKFLISGITALLICIFLIYFAQRLPVMGDNTPLIVVFYSYHLILVVVSMLTSVITFNLHQASSPVPWYIASFLRSPVAAILGIHSNKMHIIDDVSGVGEELRQYEDHPDDRRVLTGGGVRQWALVAKFIDRSMFVSYILVFLTLGLICIL